MNAVCSGFLTTGMTDESMTRIMNATGRTRENAVAELARRNPQQRLFTPEEVAAAVNDLCGEHAAGITGTTLLIDGGELRR